MINTGKFASFTIFRKVRKSTLRAKAIQVKYLLIMSSVQRALVFIDSNNPTIHHQVIDGTQPKIKLPFPPNVDPYDLVVKSRSGKIPARVPNAFIIYLKVYYETARKEGYFFPMTVTSSMASQSWERESDTVKEEYK